MAAHPTTLAHFSPLSPGMERAVRRHRLTRTCQHLGATVGELAGCRTSADLWQLRTRLLDDLMAGPTPDAA